MGKEMALKEGTMGDAIAGAVKRLLIPRYSFGAWSTPVLAERYDSLKRA